MAFQQNFLGVQRSRFDRSGVLLRLAILTIAALFAGTAHAQVLGPGWWKAPGGGGSNPSVANNTNNAFISGGCGSGCNITVPSTTAGHAFAVGVVDFANSSPSYTVTDPQGDTCTLRANSGNGGVFGQVYEMWFICPDLAGGTTTVTITGSNSDATGVAIYELANVATSGTIYEGANGGANSGSNSISFALSGATSFSNDVVLLIGWGSSGSNTSSPGSPWVSPGSGYTSFYQLGSGIGTYTGTLTVTGATNSSFAEIAIKP